MDTREYARRLHASLYREGLQDGVELTLRLALGQREGVHGVPYEGPLPDELREWLESALENVSKDKARHGRAD